MSPDAKKRGGGSPRGEATAGTPGGATLVAACILALASALWAAFQWSELLDARSGGDVFCPLGDDGACALVWDSGLARTIGASGLPVAGWGLVWGLVALALPAWLLLRGARGESGATVWSAARWTALAGVASCLVLGGSLVLSGNLCGTCLITYVLVLAYGAVCLRESLAKRSWPAPRGAVLAASATAVLFLAGLTLGPRVPPPLAEQAPPIADAPSGGEGLEGLLAGLAPPLQQGMSDLLAQYEADHGVAERSPRSLIGPADAPVRITEFSDVLCSHCANLHKTLVEMRRRLPPDSFSIEPRHFPLNAACNPEMPEPVSQPVRCAAAKAQICMENEPGAFAFSTALFENQRSLDEEKLYELAAPYVDVARLRACVADPETDAKLKSDIAWAKEHEIRGTPLVLVNGRRASAFAPFLYALVITGGDARHPAFASLPRPRAER